MNSNAADPSPSPLSSPETQIYSDGRSREVPELRFLHYNDVYHVEASSREPVGGIARFQSLCNWYRDDSSFKGQPKPMVVFSGDAFNPSLESSVTKGKHMCPVLNQIGTEVACVGNHDLDFGVPQFQYLASQSKFPWLLANVLDPALGEDVPLGKCPKTVILTASNGIKVGFIGLVEKEWLDTINSLPPNLVFQEAATVAEQLCPKLREQGAEMIVAITHAREPNDIKLAKQIPDGLIDIILGGHDHFYGHSVVNGTHLLRSGTDFKQLSHIRASKKQDGSKKWDFEIGRRDITRDIPEDKNALALVEELTSALKAKLQKPIGYTLAPLDARFTTVRRKESNLGNFVCDLMRLYYQADCTLMAGGTIRGDQVYPPGVIRLADIMNCFPFEDPVVVLGVKGKAIEEALENSVSTYPALEGRFPQVSQIRFKFDPAAKPMSRVSDVEIAGAPIDHDKTYKLATRDYMARGKDGYDSLLAKSEGGVAEELVSEENGMLISTLLRQYFQSLRTIGRWKRWNGNLDAHWETVHSDLHSKHPAREPVPISESSATKQVKSEGSKVPVTLEPVAGHSQQTDVDSDSEDESELAPRHDPKNNQEYELIVMRKFLHKWYRLAGIPGDPDLCAEERGDLTISWTKCIAPQLEGRIIEVRREIDPVA